MTERRLNSQPTFIMLIKNFICSVNCVFLLSKQGDSGPLEADQRSITVRSLDRYTK
jgi:hypothetical protein